MSLTLYFIRERNREHAKQSRIRKKVLLDSLQDQLANLRKINNSLRKIVLERIPDQAAQILTECTTEESSLLVPVRLDDGDASTASDDASHENVSAPVNLPMTSSSSYRTRRHVGGPSRGNTSAPSPPRILMESDYRLIHSLVKSQQNFVLSDPSLPDNPIVYASDGFCTMTGYKRHQVLGRNCRFLQGPDTDQSAVEIIRKGMKEGKDVSVCLLNYKADGSPFWNQFFLAALRDATGKVINYVGVQCEVNAIPVTEFKDRIKRLPVPADA